MIDTDGKAKNSNQWRPLLRILTVDALALIVLFGLQANTLREFLIFVGGVGVGVLMFIDNPNWR